MLCRLLFRQVSLQGGLLVVDAESGDEHVDDGYGEDDGGDDVVHHLRPPLVLLAVVVGMADENQDDPHDYLRSTTIIIRNVNLIVTLYRLAATCRERLMDMRATLA